MTASELRIGNYVSIKNHINLCKVVEIKEQTLRVEYFREDVKLLHRPVIEMERIKPIPLTEEWLLKFGFININNDNDECYIHPFLTHCHIEYEDSETTDEKFLTLYFHSGCYNENCSRYNGYDIRLFSVNQLQNLFFSLTEEELTIKK